MTNKPNTAPAPPPPLLSDLAACEKEIETYLARLTSQSPATPDSYVPFALNGTQATEAFDRWLKQLSLVPGDLKTSAKLNGLDARMVPFWVVSSMAYCSYKGERGDNYKENESYTDPQGQHKTREVTKVAWKPASGEVRHHFEGVVFCGMTTLPADHAKLLQATDLRRAAHYSPGAADGAKLEKSNLDPRACFNKARATMEESLKKAVEKDIGGNQQKVSKLETRHTGVGVKQVLVPAYSGSFTYKGKEYPVFINGATGEVAGEYPVSAGKVALVVVIFLLIVAAIIAAAYFFLIRPNMHKVEAPSAPAVRVVCEAPHLPDDVGAVAGGVGGVPIEVEQGLAFIHNQA
jgi:hypothetical protein